MLDFVFIWSKDPPGAELRFPPLLSHGKTKSFRQVVPRNTPSPERYIFGVKATIILLNSEIKEFLSPSIHKSDDEPI
jgi:hypothetical protein